MKEEKSRQLSILVPLFNEAATIEAVLERVRAVDLSPLGLRKQLIVADDGSTDGGAEIVRRWLKAHADVEAKLIVLERNRGKGYALRRALEAAGGEFVIVQDADLEYDPRDWLTLLEPLIAGQTQVVYGSRVMPLGEDRRRRRVYKIGLVIAKAVLLMLYGRSFTDMATCYKAFRTDLLRSLELERERFEFCPEVTVKLLNRGIDIMELPVSYRPRYKEHGKKIRWHDFFAAMATIFRYRFHDPGRGKKKSE